MMDATQTRNILEACLLVAGKALNIAQLEALFESDIDRPDRNEIKAALTDLQAEYEGRGIELVEVASGWRLQSRVGMDHWVGRLFQEKTPRYSRALLETLVLIAYRQPITRGEIEEVRGVAVSSNIIKTLQEREWVKEIGYKDVPGKPALWGTTRQFLDYFNLKRLDELPTLAEARELEEIESTLAAEMGLADGVTPGEAANDSGEEAGSSDVKDTTDAAASEAVSVVDVEVGVDEVPGEESGEEPGDELSEELGDEPDEEPDEEPENQLASLASGLPGAELSSSREDLSALVDKFVESTDVEALSEDTQDVTEDTQEDTQEDEPVAETRAEIVPEIVSADDLIIEEWTPPSQPQATEKPKTAEDDFQSVAPMTDSSSGSTDSPVDDLDGSSDDEPEDAQTQMRKVIDEFANEHRRELEARKKLDAQNLRTVKSRVVELSDTGNTQNLQETHAETGQAEALEPESVGAGSEIARHAKRTTLFGISGAVQTELQADKDVGEDVDVETDANTSADGLGESIADSESDQCSDDSTDGRDSEP